MRDKVKVFKALSDKNRLRILKMLESRPLCVCEITAVLGLAPSTVSKHLSILKDARLILEEKENKWVIHQLNWKSEENSVREILSLISKWISDDPLIQVDRMKAGNVDRNCLCKSNHR